MSSSTEFEVVSHSVCTAAAQTDGEFFVVEPAAVIRTVIFPPLPTTSGKRYYCCAPCHRVGPRVICGWSNVNHILGSFCSGGTAPKGFDNLEAAIAQCIHDWYGYNSIIVQYS